MRIKYKTPEGDKVYTKKGFTTKKAAEQHEAEMKVKLSNPTYTPIAASHGKMTVQEYMETWVEQHGKANLRPSTFASYKGYIKNYIVPNLGHVQLRELTPAMLDGMFQKMFDKGLSQSSVRYAQRIMSVAMEGARKYHYIEGKQTVLDAYHNALYPNRAKKEPAQPKKTQKKKGRDMER